MMSSLAFLIFLAPAWGEEPPEPEYPYPKKSQSSSLREQVEQPLKIDSNGTYYYSNEKVSAKKMDQGVSGVEAPTRVDPDGTYYYGDSDSQKKSESNIPGAEQPIEQDAEGSYYYDPKKAKPIDREKILGEKPTSIKEDGTFYYDGDFETSTKAFTFRLGMMSPPQIKPATPNGLGYEEIYSKNSLFNLALEYDWLLMDSLYLKVGSGVGVAQGKGQFASAQNSDLTPRETFQFYIFPNLASLGYLFAFSQEPLLTPYLEAGAGYFTFMESRSDGKSSKFGGAPVLAASAGVLISLTKYSRNPELSHSYGIKQMWLDLQFKQIIGLDERKDFTSNNITVGFAFGF